MNLVPQKRIEIVVDGSNLYRVLEILDVLEEVPGYTVLPEVQGSGDRGYQYADDLSGSSANAYVLVAVPPENVEAITEQIGPIIQEYGGLYLVGDCQWLEH